MFDEKQSGQPVSVTHGNNQRQVNSLIQGNRWIAGKLVAWQLGISQERVQYIFQTFNYRKICARLVPRHLSDVMEE